MSDQADGLRLLMKGIQKETEASRKTRIIAVTSGKGGVGKTNIATNMGIAYAQLGKKVIVIDADLGLANVNIIMNIVPQYNLYHVIRKQKKMSEIIMDTEYGIKLIVGASGISKIVNMEESERADFVQELKTLSDVDIIIIDTSAGISKNVVSFIAAADEVVIVTTAEPTAITDAYGIIKIIATEVDNANVRLKVLINRVDSASEGKRIADRMINITAQVLNLKIEYLGFIYNDSAVSKAVLKQKPFLVTAPNGKASICLKHIVARLEKTEIPEDGGLTGFIRKWFNHK